MDLLQWAITTIVGILGIWVGRAWQRYDRANEKDKKTFSIIIEALPAETILFLRSQNFGSSFSHKELNDLIYLKHGPEGSPTLIFFNRELEKTKLELFASIEAFLDICYEKVGRRFGLNDDLIRVKAPDDYEDAQEGWLKFNSDRTELREKANRVLQHYDRLNVLAHRKL